MALIRDWIKDNGGRKAVENSKDANFQPIEKCLDCIKEHFDCTICRDPLDKPIQTQCGHVFCGECLRSLCSQPSPTCPLCKKPISNRTLISRDDVGDMLNLANKLSNVFKVEVSRYLNKENCSKKSPAKAQTTTARVEQKDIIDRKKAVDSDKLSKRESRQDKDDTLQKIHSRRKSRDAETVSVVNSSTKDPETSLAAIPKPLEKNQDSEKGIGGHNGKKAIESKQGSRSEKNKQMMNQKYVIMTAEAVPEEPIDFSLPRINLDVENIKYKYNRGTIRFVKPLDLSMKKQKRKFDEMDKGFDNRAVTVIAQDPETTSISKRGTQRKRGKFEEKMQEKSCEPQNVSSKMKSVEARKPNKEPDMKNLDDDDSIIVDDPPVFTPTPPPVEPKKPIGKSANELENNSKRPRIRSQHHNARITQGNCDLASEIMRDFDLPFEDDDNFDKPLSNASSGGKITSSDEILSKITDESVAFPKPRLPTQKSQSGSSSSFVFKQPGISISQASKKKSKDEQNKKDDFPMDCDDDDFQQPRDSDLMFLDLTMSGTGGDGKKRGQTPESKSNVDMPHGSRRLSIGSGSGSDGEKENSKGRRSLSRSGKRKASPVKPKPSTSKTPVEEYSNDRRNVKSQKELKEDASAKNVYTFDDEDDEDWLLDIPEPSAKPYSGKSKQDVRKPSVAATTETVAVSKSKQYVRKSTVVEEAETVVAKETPIPKQRYVFCTTRLNKGHTVKLQELCKMCDGTITKGFTEDVTHLVINLINGRVPQTLKYLLAIASRKWVVIYDWVEECVSSGHMVPEAPYETSNFKHCDPGVKRSRLAKKNLFDGFKFYFASEMYNALGFTRSDVILLLKTLGATVVDSAETRYRELIIIGTMNGSTIMYNDWLNTNKWVTVTFEWVIECILEYRLNPFEEKHLCVDTSKIKSINAPKSFQTVLSQYISQRSPGMSPL